MTVARLWNSHPAHVPEPSNPSPCCNAQSHLAQAMLGKKTFTFRCTACQELWRRPMNEHQQGEPSFIEDSNWHEGLRAVKRGDDVPDADWNEYVSKVLAERNEDETWVVTLTRSTLTILRKDGVPS